MFSFKVFDYQFIRFDYQFITFSFKRFDYQFISNFIFHEGHRKTFRIFLVRFLRRLVRLPNGLLRFAITIPIRTIYLYVITNLFFEK